MYKQLEGELMEGKKAAATQTKQKLDLARDLVELERKHVNRLEAQIGGLFHLVDELVKALQWCGGSGDFQEGGQARAGWLKVRPLLTRQPADPDDFGFYRMTADGWEKLALPEHPYTAARLNPDGLEAEVRGVAHDAGRRTMHGGPSDTAWVNLMQAVALLDQRDVELAPLRQLAKDLVKMGSITLPNLSPEDGARWEARERMRAWWTDQVAKLRDTVAP